MNRMVLGALVGICFPMMAIAKDPANSQMFPPIYVKQPNGSPYIQDSPDVLVMTKISKNTEPEKNYINFKIDNPVKPYDIVYTFFPQFDEKEFIAENNQKMLNGTAFSSFSPFSPIPYLITIFKIGFF